MLLRTIVLLSAILFTAACSLPVETLRVAAYGEIARVQKASGDPAGARETARRAVAVIQNVDSDEERLFGVPAAAIALIRSGDVERAFSMVEKISSDHGRIIASTALALALQDLGYPAEAKNAALRALSNASRLESEDNKEEMTLYAVWAQAITGDTRGALENAKTVTRLRHRNGLLSLIAAAQVDAGDVAGALATADDLIAEKAKQSENDIWLSSLFFRGLAVDSFAVLDDFLFENRMPLKAVVMTRIAMAQLQGGDAGAARQSFLAAMQSAETADSVDDRVRSMSNIALVRARAGDFSGAIESLNHADRLAGPQRLEDGGNVGEARGHALAIRAAISGRGAPDDLVQSLGSGGPWGRETLVAAALAKMQLGKTQQAGEYLDAAAGTSQNDDLSLVVAAYGNLADVKAGMGDKAGGRAAARRSLEIAESIPDTSVDRAIGLYFASVAVARTGDVDLAFETAARIEKPKEPQ